MAEVENINDALSVLIQGVEIAQTKGIYSFSESRLIADALDYIDSISKKKDEPEIKKEEENKE